MQAVNSTEPSWEKRRLTCGHETNKKAPSSWRCRMSPGRARSHWPCAWIWARWSRVVFPVGRARAHPWPGWCATL